MKRIIAIISFLLAVSASADQSWPGDFRISLYGSASTLTEESGGKNTIQEMVTHVSFHSPFRNSEEGLDYAVDFRNAAYPGAEGRDSRFSLYNAYVGYSTKQFLGRAGQMWLNELGALGSIGGGLFEYRGIKTDIGRFRLGGFGGKEPEILDAGYVNDVTKLGGYMAIDGENGRNHVFGYVRISNAGWTERSVVVLNNFLPVKSEFFLYQLAEIDLAGPADFQEGGGLNYFFVNGRYITPSRFFEVQGSFHHGRSVDARSITLDQINGRPVPPAALQGLLFESSNARVTVRAVRELLVFAGFGSDRNNREDERTNRITYGFFSAGIFRSGMDLSFTGTRYSPPAGSAYDTWSISAGRSIGQKVYLSGNFTSAGSVTRISDVEAIILEPGPRTDFWSISTLIHATRSISFLTTLDYVNSDTYSETRLLAGITYRFRAHKK